MRYSNFDVLALRGHEALAFAQAQLASDVLALEDGRWQWSAYLTPQGRAIVVMPIVRLAADALDLLVPAERGAEVAQRLQRFVFRTKVAIAMRGDVGARARLHAPAERPVTIERSGDGYRVDLSETVSLDVGAAPSDGDETGFRAWAHDAAVPLLAGAAVEAHTPHALALDALDAVSTRKGCYPGQEIVARMHFLGRNKRHLCRFAAVTPADAPEPVPEPGAAITLDDGTAAAEIVFALKAESGNLRGLAVAHEQGLANASGYRVGGMAVVLVRVR